MRRTFRRSEPTTGSHRVTVVSERSTAVVAGLVAAFVGFSSSFVVVLQGLGKVGATPTQATSGLTALAVVFGLGSVVLSLRSQMPISLAWSTPGAAVLAGATVTQAGPDGFRTAVGGFLLSGALIVLSGLWGRLGRWVAAIPGPLANAMLAGVLLPLCLAPARGVTQQPVPALLIIGTWAAVAVVRRTYAVPAAVVVTLITVAVTGDLTSVRPDTLLPHPTFVVPSLSTGAVLGIALPLFIATMASQNVPGIAVLGVNGYRPPPGPLFTWTGVLTLVVAPFGGHAVNLAAITAALSAGRDAGDDPAGRYRAAVACGAGYVVLGLGAGAVVALISTSPPVLIETIAGIALLGALGNALQGAVGDAEGREAAVVTFVVTVSGISVLGVGGAFWGLVAGGVVYLLQGRPGRAADPDPPTSRVPRHLADGPPADDHPAR